MRPFVRILITTRAISTTTLLAYFSVAPADATITIKLNTTKTIKIQLVT